MNIYGEEVLIIPANDTIKLAKDSNCALYECPASEKGQYWTRAQCRPLYVAFRERGEITHLYKIQDIVVLRFGDTTAIDSLSKSSMYPNIKNRIDFYMKNNTKLNLTADKYVFILSQNETIELPYTVVYSKGTKGKSGHEFRKLHEMIGKPLNGYDKIILNSKINKP